jgi:hypothetical protein
MMEPILKHVVDPSTDCDFNQAAPHPSHCTRRAVAVFVSRMSELGQERP